MEQRVQQRRRSIQWRLHADVDQQASFWQQRLGIDRLLALVLATRRITEEQLPSWFSSQPRWHDPFLLHGMDRAVERIRCALHRGERILVYGDYDADGVSSVALMVCLLRQLRASFWVDIPHRMTEGYGVHRSAIDRAVGRGCTLMITVDTGISAVEPIQYAQERGIDVIITDHHEVPALLPAAYATINPKLPYCSYPFGQLAGVGVALKLAQALLGQLPRELVALAAIGTVADMMPLVGENRAIVQAGILQLRNEPLPGVAALLRVLGQRADTINAQTLGYVIAPRLNAAGRLARADDAVRLLIADDVATAQPIADKLHKLNEQRQQLVEQTVLEAVQLIEQRRAYATEGAIVVGQEGWHPGVIGIAAARLLERYGLSTIVFSIAQGKAKGSARASPGVHLMHALSACAQQIEQYGGHASAAGLTVSASQLAAFSDAFSQKIQQQEHADAVPMVGVDGVIQTNDVTVNAIEQLERLAPYGQEHPMPTFVLRHVRVHQSTLIGRERQHLKATLVDEYGSIEAIQFRYEGTQSMEALSAQPIDVIVEPTLQRFRGACKPQLIVKHWII